MMDVFSVGTKFKICATVSGNCMEETSHYKYKIFSHQGSDLAFALPEKSFKVLGIVNERVTAMTSTQ